jgi:hypothetical protein
MRRFESVVHGGALLLLLAATAAVVTGDRPVLSTPARAAVPAVVPSFTHPTEISHPFFTFEPGAMMVFKGRSDGEDRHVVLDFLHATREFEWNGQTVACRIIKETEFGDGDLTEISYEYYAQGDDGSIYYFGEVTEEFEAGEVVSEEGTWLVGGPGPGDPPSTVTGTDPGLHLPAVLEEGDVWMREDLPAHGIHEQRRVLRASKKIKVPAGKFRGTVEVEERDDEGEKERKWYAPGVGLVRVKGEDERLKLVATSVRPR